MKTIINTKNAPAPIGPYNQAVLKGNLLFTSGQIAIDPKTGELNTEDIKAETKTVMENLKAVLQEAEMTFDNEEDLISQLIPEQDGLILQYKNNKGTFLPSVWEQLPQPVEFIKQLKLKAGLDQTFWHSEIKASRYRCDIID